MLIGELAGELGVTPKTLRHYERIGLIPAAQRQPNGYRVYSAAAARLARLVVSLRQLDLPLDAIAKLLSGGDGRNLRHRLMGQLDEQIREAELEIAVLQGRRDDLQARYVALLDTRSEASGDCICGALLRACDCSGGEKP